MSELNPLADVPEPDDSSLSSFDDFLPGEPATDGPRLREGLPSGYRMRADAHYVEQLETARQTPSARRAATPSAVSTPTSPQSHTEGDVLAALKAIGSCAALAEDDVTGLTRRVATSLIRAEAWRSTCLLQAARILRQGVVPTRRATPVRQVFSKVVESVEQERRLRGVQVDALVSVSESASVTGQEEPLVFVLSGLLLLTIELAAATDDASVLVAALPEPAGRITIAVSQDAVAVPESWPSVVGEPGTAQAGTWSTPVPILALRRLAEAYGGSVSTTRFANGSRVMLELPAAGKPA